MKATYFNSYHKLQSRREKPSSHVGLLQGFSRVILTLNFLCLAPRLQMLYDLFSCCGTNCHRFSCLKNTHAHQLTGSGARAWLSRVLCQGLPRGQSGF